MDSQNLLLYAVSYNENAKDLRHVQILPTATEELRVQEKVSLQYPVVNHPESPLIFRRNHSVHKKIQCGLTVQFLNLLSISDHKVKFFYTIHVSLDILRHFYSSEQVPSRYGFFRSCLVLCSS